MGDVVRRCWSDLDVFEELSIISLILIIVNHLFLFEIEFEMEPLFDLVKKILITNYTFHLFDNP